MEIFRRSQQAEGLTREELSAAVEASLQGRDLHKVLILPPDFTRYHSNAGLLTNLYYHFLTDAGVQVDILPALGTHVPVTEEEMDLMFGDIPHDRFLIHHWRTDVVKLGEVPASYLEEVTEGLWHDPIDVEVNRLVMDPTYDLVLSIGQVVPHEVVGMANYSKNIFVGTGGREMINKSHMLSAICGMEKALGVIDSPARKLYDYAQQHFIDGKLPLVYLQTVTTREGEEVQLRGLYIGQSRKPFELAAKLSQELNIVHVERRAKKVVTYLEPSELKTTWVGNKGIYRTRMTVADGGELLILAPGIRAFGENEEMDAMTRKYGYTGTPHILELYRQGAFEGRLMSAAHLIQGSTEGRFTVTYATKPDLMSQEEIESVGYQWADYNEVSKRYDPEKLHDGWNILPDGEEIYYVGTPALGLWKVDE